MREKRERKEREIGEMRADEHYTYAY